MKIGVVAKFHGADFAQPLQEIVDWLQERRCQVLVEAGTIDHFGLANVSETPVEDVARNADVLAVFGGDGTLLASARRAAPHGTPIMGVNLGSLGFLTSVKPEEIYTALQHVLAGQYVVEQREMLMAEVHLPDGPAVRHHALNDVVINKGALARIISLETRIEGDFLAQFLSDGLIVSTPTGSTAYSLSAGGPIVHPSLSALVLTPICPHTLTNRPVVVPGDRKVEVTLTEGEDVMLTIDGQVGVALTPGSRIVCTRSPQSISLLQPSQRSFFDVLREKLKWGER